MKEVRCPTCHLLLCKTTPEQTACALILCRHCKLEWYLVVTAKKEEFSVSMISLKQALVARLEGKARDALALLSPFSNQSFIGVEALREVFSRAASH